MFKDDSINLTYKRQRLPETNDKTVRGGRGVTFKQFTVVIHRYSRGTAVLDIQ